MTASAARVIDRPPSPKCSLTAGGIVPAGRPMRTAAASGPNQSARPTNRMKPIEQNTADRPERFFTGDCLCANRFSSKPRRKTCGSQVLQTAEVSLPSRPPSSANRSRPVHLRVGWLKFGLRQRATECNSSALLVPRANRGLRGQPGQHSSLVSSNTVVFRAGVSQ